MTPLDTSNLEPGELAQLEQIKGQIEANRGGHDAYVAARDAGDQAGMDMNKPSFDAFEIYAEEARREAARLGVDLKDFPDAPPQATQPADVEDPGAKIPAKPDKDSPGDPRV